MKRVAIFGSAIAMAAMMGATAQAQFKSSLNESQATANESARSQQNVDRLDDQTASLINDFRANLKQLEAAKRYNESLAKQTAAQERQIARILLDIENVSGLQRAVAPLMEDMANRFQDIVNADIPFDISSRRQRAEDRIAMLDKPEGEVSVAQKYRLLVEAYQIEMEFGRTIGATQGAIDVDGASLQGEFLRVGRVTLVFKTPDDSVLKVWNKRARGWEDLNKSYLADVKLGLRMAKEQTAPGLLPIPVLPSSAAE